MLTPRQQQLLCLVIQDYILTSDPVGSHNLVKKYRLKVSPATVRHELAELEKLGYLVQPHTSSGRVPSETAYQFYIDQNLEFHQYIKLEKALVQLLKDSLYEQAIKNVAKLIAQLSGQALIVGFKFNHAYYTGLSNLFHQAEFQQYQTILNLTSTIDRLDDLLAQIFKSVDDQTRVLIGHENPFGCQTSLILSRFHYQDREPGVLGLWGPLRMDYNKNYSFVRQAKETIDNFKA